MFTFVIAKYLKLENEGLKVLMMLVAMCVDFVLIMIVLESLGILKG